MTKEKTRTATWVKVLLAISLALNLAVIGMLGGAALRGHSPRAQTAEGVSILARAMPFKFQTQLRGAIRDRRNDLRPDREAMRLLRTNLIDALEAEPFDISAVETVLSNQRTLLSNLIVVGHSEVIAQIAAMDAQDRARYVENLQKPPRHPRYNQP